MDIQKDAIIAEKMCSPLFYNISLISIGTAINTASFFKIWLEYVDVKYSIRFIFNHANLPFPEGLVVMNGMQKQEGNHFCQIRLFNPIFGTWNMPVELHQTFLLSYLRIVYQHKDNSDLTMFRL